MVQPLLHAGRLALLALLLAPATAGAATVKVGGGAPVDLATVAPDVQTRTVPVPGGSRTVSGVSLAAVLRAAGAELDAWSYAGVGALGGEVPAIPRSRALATGDEAVVFTGDGALVRPATGRDPGAVVTASAYEVQLLPTLRARLEATASTLRPRVGERVRFRARVTGLAVGEQASGWSFTVLKPFKTVEQRSFSLRFDEPGEVVVTAGADTEGKRLDDLLELTVRKAEPEPQPDAEPAPKPDPSSSTPDGPGIGAAPPGLGNGGAGTGRTGSGGTGTGDGPATSGADPAADPAATPDATPSPAPTPAPADRSVSIEGRVLLEPVAFTTPADPGGDAGGPEAAVVEPPPDPLRLPPGVWVALACATLLAVGVWREVWWRR